MNNIKVCVAIPCYSGYVPIEFSLALSKLVLQADLYGITLDLVCNKGNGLITSSRNLLLSDFFQTDAEYLFWIDDDIIFTVEDFVKVVQIAVKYKSSAASYCVKQDTPKFHIKKVTDEPSEEGYILSNGLGLGFACQHRSVLLDLAKTKETYKDNNRRIHNVFQTRVYNNQYQGEDMMFFQDIHELGYVTYVDPCINLQHVGTKVYDHTLKEK
jgi:hypothetical protein